MRALRDEMAALSPKARRERYTLRGDRADVEYVRILHLAASTSERSVEAALDAHPAVLESAVLGLPDAEWGELVAAAHPVAPEPVGMHRRGESQREGAQEGDKPAGLHGDFLVSW